MIGERRQRDAKSGWNSSRRGRCASLLAIEIVFGEVCVCLLRHCVLWEREQNAVGKVEDRHSGGGRGRKRGLARKLGVAWGSFFFW